MTKRPHPGTWGPQALGLALILLGGPVSRAQEGIEDRLGATRIALEKWVETGRVISKEKADWALGREVLANRIELVRQEIASLRERIASVREDIAKADKSKADLVEENEKLKQASSVLSEGVTELEGRVKSLLHRLPEAIQELDQVRPLSQRIPENPEETDQSLSARFMNIVGIMNALNKFNREITFTPERRELPSGETVLVTVLYVGLGQAWYVSDDGRIAGIGTASEGGWKWIPANEAGPEIAKAIAILKSEKSAEFVRLPIRIR